MRIVPTLAVLASLATSPAFAQAAPPPPPPLVQTQDVATPEATVNALYDVISGPAGARNWDRMRKLLTPNARFIAAAVGKDGAVTTHDMSTDEYIAHASPFFAKQGFYEHGVALRILRYGHTAVVESPYESRRAPGEAPFARGINEFVLLNDGVRWWVTEVIWEGESASNPLPADADAALKAR
jgi:hypothetical protein